MFACGLSSYTNFGDFYDSSVMCSGNNHIYDTSSALNQQYNSKEFSNGKTPHSPNSNIIKQCQQYNMLQENIESSNTSKCIVKYNSDQTTFLYEEFYNQTSAKEVNMKNMHYVNNHLHSHIPLSYTRKTSFKPNLKRKRRRTIFTTEQIIALEEVFKRKPYVHREERIELMNKLHINERSIKVWFQNRRRLSDKKCKDYNLDSPLSENSSETRSDRITSIESYIEQNSDENGYVTLDDEMMTNLVVMIDECLPQGIDLEKAPTESATCDSKVIYEPISPVSVSENCEIQDESVTFENQDLLLGISDYYYL